MAEDSKRDDKTDMSTEGTNFIAIESFYRLSYARELCLKADDVFVAIDHNPITWDIDKFDNKLSDHEELPALFTIFRKGEFFEVFVEQSLNCNYKYASDEDVAKITEKLPEHQIEPKENYKSFEAQRDMRRNVQLYSTEHSAYATLVPPFWLLYHRMWAPLAAVLVTYAVTFLIHPILFGLIYVMMSVYFHKAQVTMLRGYALYLEYTFWFVFAECSTRRAQEMLRRFDPKCRFKFSYVPEPVVDEAEEERIANLMREARAELEAEANI